MNLFQNVFNIMNVVLIGLIIISILQIQSKVSFLESRIGNLQNKVSDGITLQKYHEIVFKVKYEKNR